MRMKFCPQRSRPRRAGILKQDGGRDFLAACLFRERKTIFFMAIEAWGIEQKRADVSVRSFVRLFWRTRGTNLSTASRPFSVLLLCCRFASMSGNVVLFQLVLHEAAGYAEQFCGMCLHEVGAHESPLDERGLYLVQSVGQIELYGQQVHGALEL